jgi:hypothetical protein
MQVDEVTDVWGPFEKIVDSHYSESELYGGAVTASFEVPPLGNDALFTTFHPVLENVLQTVCRKLQEDPRSSLLMVEEAHKSYGARSGLYGGCSNGVPPIKFFQAEHRIQSRNAADASLRKHLVAPPS